MIKKFLSVLFFAILLSLQHVDASHLEQGFGRTTSLDDELPFPMILAKAAERKNGIPFVLISSPICWQPYTKNKHNTKIKHSRSPFNLGSSSTELDQLNSEVDDFAPVVGASTVDVDTFVAQHSPEGVSLYPFSPVTLKKDASDVIKKKRPFPGIPRYLAYIQAYEKMVQTDDEGWRFIALVRKSGKF
jgi:hypothetical protein